MAFRLNKMNVLALALVTSMTSIVAVTFESSGYPSYCAKDMSGSVIQPLTDPLSQDLSLVQVQIIVRHGARTPWSSSLCWDGYDEQWDCNIRDIMRPALISSNEISSKREFEKIYLSGKNILQGNCNLGQMIDEGYVQQQQNGQHFRDVYIGNHSLALFDQNEMIDITNTSDIYFESTDIPRTINSGQIIVDAMFSSIKGDTKRSVPWHTQDYAMSSTTPNAKVCPKLIDIDSKWKSSAQFISWNNSAANVLLDKKLEKYFNNFDHSTLFDCLMTSNGFSDDIFLEATSREESFQMRQYLFDKNSYAKVGMAEFIEILRNRMLLATMKQAPRFVLSAAHDTTIMPILSALGGQKWLTEWVPYASHLIFELYAARGTNNYFVRILYQGKPLPIDDCNSELCPLSDFIKITNFSTEENICQTPEDIVGFGTRNALNSPSLPIAAIVGFSGFGGCVIGLVCGLLLSGRYHASRQGYNCV